MMKTKNPTKAEVRPASVTYPLHQVLVFEFKENTLRGDAYWVFREIKTYRLRSDAELYASRFNKE